MTEEELSAEMAKKVRILARRRGWSIERLADFSGCSHATLWALMRGEGLPSLRTILRLATALDVRPRDLLP